MQYIRFSPVISTANRSIARITFDGSGINHLNKLVIHIGCRFNNATADALDGWLEWNLYCGRSNTICINAQLYDVRLSDIGNIDGISAERNVNIVSLPGKARRFEGVGIPLGIEVELDNIAGIVADQRDAARNAGARSLTVTVIVAMNHHS